MADTTNYGILRLIVSDPDKAENALHEAGMTVTITTVLGIGIPDVPGGFSKAIRVLSDENISVEYAYAFITPRVGKAYVIIRVEDNEKAAQVLKEKGITLIEQDDIFSTSPLANVAAPLVGAAFYILVGLSCTCVLHVI